ncbi:MAG: zinc-binding dehydrogenase [Rhodospirillales bacterium]|nr:zinc-binding dehydrogenase [Rhodospirillales bacterium]
MRAVVLGENGIEVREVAKPTPGPCEVLVCVKAASLNRADVLIASGQAHGFAAGPGVIMGGECAGEVEAIGSAVTDLKIGDRVAGSARSAFADYVTMDSGRAYKISSAIPNTKATCFPYAVQTMHDAIVSVGGLRQGETVLVQGASSAMGLLGMQVAKLKGASLVIGTSANESRRDRLREFGCDLALDSHDPSWPEKVKTATGGKGVDLIIDQVSAGVANGNLDAAAVLGRIVNVGRLGGMKGDFDFDLHALKRVSYIGVTFRTRSIEEYRAVVRAARMDLWSGVETGALRMPIDRIFPLEQAPSAFAHMSENAHFGKIVLAL